jgi:hypothetical protein
MCKSCSSSLDESSNVGNDFRVRPDFSTLGFCGLGALLGRFFFNNMAFCFFSFCFDGLSGGSDAAFGTPGVGARDAALSVAPVDVASVSSFLFFANSMSVLSRFCGGVLIFSNSDKVATDLPGDEVVVVGLAFAEGSTGFLIPLPGDRDWVLVEGLSFRFLEANDPSASFIND